MHIALVVIILIVCLIIWWLTFIELRGIRNAITHANNTMVKIHDYWRKEHLKD